MEGFSCGLRSFRVVELGLCFSDSFVIFLFLNFVKKVKINLEKCFLDFSIWRNCVYVFRSVFFWVCYIVWFCIR